MAATIASDFAWSPCPVRRPGGEAALRRSRMIRTTPMTPTGATALFVRTAPPRCHTAAVYRPRRIVAAAGLAFLAIGVWWAVRALVDGPATALPPSRPIASRVWIVHPGDTLWGIALASGDKGDIRPLVDELFAEVHGQPLTVGERITLP